ncbi:MAG: Lon protease family protein [Chloroflexota bacterium]
MITTKDRCKLSPGELRWRCDPDCFSFGSTAEVPLLQEFVGQDRALKAIEFGLAIEKPGYNIFVTGLTGTGKASAIQTYLQRAVAARVALGDGHPYSDWCYVHNFLDPDHPVALSLPAGRGAELKQMMDDVVKNLRSLIVRAFSEDRYQSAKQGIAAEVGEQQQKMWQEVDAEARQKGFVLQMAASEISLFPLIDGQPASQEQLLALKDEERAALEQKHAELAQLVAETMQRSHVLQREANEKLANLGRRILEAAVGVALQEVVAHFSDLAEVSNYLAQVRRYAVERADLARTEEGAEPQQAQSAPLARHDDPFLPFRVNLFVDNSRSVGPPIVIENNANFTNMFGRLERRPVMGGYVTDHTMLKPGALAVANGGYLVATAREVFSNAGVWDGLKRAIRANEVRIEEPSDPLGLAAVQGLKPQPIPLDIKIVLLGDSALYRIASMGDEDFWEIFKVKAEFDREIDRTNENLKVYASFIATCCETEKLLHFDRTGVAAVLEEAARTVEDQNRLSARFGQIRDLLIEADYWARREEAAAVSSTHVHRAIAERTHRVNLIEEKLREMVEQGVLLVDVDGAVVGQINGLSVLDLGDLTFGSPARITARTYAGRAGVVNIEREAQLSGKTHDKGVLILGGLLGSRYAQQQPLSLAATLCFEQSYNGVDGDSASSTEFYALLSSLAGLPIDQSLAVTGSVNQKGEIQAIGGVNQKVEGYFDVCRLKGITGHQGVMIPRANVRHLMLREDVVTAVAAGQFHLYAVSSVDEGIEILTGVPAGAPSADGSYPEGTVNALAAGRLAQFADAVRRARAMGDGKA